MSQFDSFSFHFLCQCYIQSTKKTEIRRKKNRQWSMNNSSSNICAKDCSLFFWLNILYGDGVAAIHDNYTTAVLFYFFSISPWSSRAMKIGAGVSPLRQRVIYLNTLIRIDICFIFICYFDFIFTPLQLYTIIYFASTVLCSGCDWF